MFKIKSIKQTNQLPKNANQNINDTNCNIQLQCNLGDEIIHNRVIDRFKQRMNKSRQHFHEHNHNEPKITKYMNRSMQDKLKSCYRLDNAQNRIYYQVRIRNIYKNQYKLIKLLQQIAMNKKHDMNSLLLIRNKKISFLDQQSHNFESKLQINMEIMYKLYLQSNKELLNIAILQGKVLNKIIRPFLSIFESISKDSQNIDLKFTTSSNKKLKQIHKSQLLKLLSRYKPKTDLSNEMSRNLKKSANIYQQMYSKYENSPFYGYLNQQDKQIEQSVHNSELRQTKWNEEQVIAQNEREEDEQGNSQNQSYNQQQIDDRQLSSSSKSSCKQLKPFTADQIMRIQEENVLNMRRQAQSAELSNPNSSKSCQIKERFQDRFKRQLKALTDDANIIIKNRIA